MFRLKLRRPDTPALAAVVNVRQPTAPNPMVTERRPKRERNKRVRVGSGYLEPAEPPHVCDVPSEDHPCPVGSRWVCDCGRIWTLETTPGTGGTGRHWRASAARVQPW